MVSILCSQRKGRGFNSPWEYVGNEKKKLAQYGLEIILDNGHQPPTLWYDTLKLRTIAMKAYKAGGHVKHMKKVSRDK